MDANACLIDLPRINVAITETAGRIDVQLTTEVNTEVSDLRRRAHLLGSTAQL